MFISPQMAFSFADDSAEQLRDIVKLGEGTGATNGVVWGDYSGCVINGNNFFETLHSVIC